MQKKLFYNLRPWIVICMIYNIFKFQLCSLKIVNIAKNLFFWFVLPCLYISWNKSKIKTFCIHYFLIRTLLLAIFSARMTSGIRIPLWSTYVLHRQEFSYTDIDNSNNVIWVQTGPDGSRRVQTGPDGSKKFQMGPDRSILAKSL